MKYSVPYVVVCLGFLLALPVFADTLIRTSSQFELPSGQVTEGNFLGVGNPVSVAGEVTQDATLIGNRVTMTGLVGGDLLATGVLTRLDGIIQEDVRVLSGNTTISGTIAGDVIIAGGSVDVLSDAVIEGDLVLYVGTAQVSGLVGGDIFGAVQNLSLDGSVGGLIDVHVTQLILGANASITDSVRYTSYNLLSQSPDTIIGGSVIRNDPVYSPTTFSLSLAVYPVLILLFSTLVWFTLSKQTLANLVQRTVSTLPRSAITGVISFFVLPLIVFVLSVGLLGGYLWISDLTATGSIITLIAALLPVLIVLFGFLTLFLLAVLATPALLGQLAMYVTKTVDQDVSVLSIFIGSLVCVILLLLPVVGLFIILFVSVILLGGLLEGLIKASR